MSKLKKALLISALLIIAILIGYGLFYFFRRSPTGQNIFGPLPTTSSTNQFPNSTIRTSTLPTDQISNPNNNQLPSSRNPNPTYYKPDVVRVATTDPAVFTSINTQGQTRYYNEGDGKFYQINSDGSIKPLSDQIFYGAQNVTWSKAQNKAVVEFPDSSKIVYNFDTKKQTTLPKYWENFSFSSDGNELAAKSIGLSPENRWLVTTKDDGTGTKFIENLGDYADRVAVNWSPSRQVVAFSQTGEPAGGGLDRRQILLLGTQGENLKSLTIEGLDFLPQWSPSGKQLLYSVDSSRTNFKPELWFVDAYGDSIGNNRANLQIATWANKCTFATDTTVFCAVPRDLPDGSGISPEIAGGSSDDLFKIDLKSGTKIPVSLGDKNYNVGTISYNKEKNSIFFTDKSQTGIFEVKL